MKHYYIETDSIPWAVAFAGCMKECLNNGIKFSVKTNNEILKPLSETFEPFSSSAEKIDIPVTEKELKNLSLLAKYKQEQEITKIHGYKVDFGDVGIQSLGTIASIIIWKVTGCFVEPCVWYPSFSKTTVLQSGLLDYNCIITKEEYREFAVSWFEGYNQKPEILLTGDYYKLTVGVDAGIKLIVTEVENEILHIIRAKFGGYDNIDKSPVVVAINSNGYAPNYDGLVGWAACHVLKPESYVITELGKLRRIQEKCRFNYANYVKNKDKF